MEIVWIVVAFVVGVATGAVGLSLLRRRAVDDALSRLVADALANEWAERTGRDTDLVRSAMLQGRPPDVYGELAALVANVQVTFEYDGSRTIRAIVECRYAAGGSITTVTLKVPWERVPQAVREQFLRSGDKQVSRRWAIHRPA